MLDLAGSIPLSQIPDYIQEKIMEKRKLDEDIAKLADEQLQAKATLQQALHEKKVSLAELAQFSNLKAELDKLHISVEDIRRTVGIIRVRGHGYNVDTITLLVSNWEASAAMQAELEKSVNSLTITKHDLEEECNRLEELKKDLSIARQSRKYKNSKTKASVLKS
jgi:hypothetical protein